MISFIEFMQILENTFDLHCEQEGSELTYKILLPEGTHLQVICDEKTYEHIAHTLPKSIPSNMDWNYFALRVLEFNRHSLQKLNAGIYLDEENHQYYLCWYPPTGYQEERVWHDYFHVIDTLSHSMNDMLNGQVLPSPHLLA